MKILIAGAGAIGSIFGGFLKKGGNSVTMVGRGVHFDAMRQNSLSICGIWGDHKIHGFELANHFSDLKDPFDFILCCVKSFDTETVATAFRHLLHEKSVVVSLQNGLGNVELIRKGASFDAVMGGRVIFGATRCGNGCVKVTVYTEPVMVGFDKFAQEVVTNEIVECARQFASTVEECGIPCKFTADIEQFQWGKLLYSCALNPLSAIHRVAYGELPKREEWRNCMDSVIDEIFAVASAKGIPLLWQSADDYRELFYSKLVPDTANHKSSMLQDIEAEKKSEIESMCGVVVRYGEESGISTPQNRRLLYEIRKISSK